ncbi:hypothetical protein [Flavobacterium columnare]|uniref:hypothetical protein n=1 Tax=Flavobacterium columnare TaxID=996 RepID=UPI0018967F0A|nr:hypothetical protein [Flavobacterium columnare]
MPNLNNPLKIDTFGYLKYIKSIYDAFTKSDSDLIVPIADAFFYNTDLNSQKIHLKIGKDNREVFGAITLEELEIKNVKYHVVKMVASNSKNLNQGVVRALYRRAVELNFKLITDKDHTTYGSKDIWLKFPTYFPEKNLFVINLNTANPSKRKLTNQSEYKIWGKEEDEYFDIQEKEDKIYLIEELFNSKVISPQQKAFFIENIDNLTDKKNIRLILD